MAYSYFQSAAEKGDMESNRMLGKMHEKGEGVPVTLREAVYYYRLAALDGDIESLRRVCDCYLNGRGVERDLEAAKVWLWRLWQTGDADAVVRFGDVLMQQGDYVAARRLWLDLAKSWNQRLASAANYRLASIYHRGLGVKPDTRKADKYSKLAMDFNNPKEVCGRSRNLIAAGQAEEAVVLLEACIDPTGESLCILGSIRITGQGVRKDVETGVTNLRAAAKMGHLEAKYLLAYATVQKIPGAPDLDEADRLLDEAEAGGHPKARELRSKLDRMRTSAREEVPATPVPDEDDRAHPG
jgi:TPR repeat protein